MKRLEAEYPYDNYYLYIVFHNKEGRYMANLIPKDKTMKRTTISYARYLMSVKEERILESYEHVDHIDENKTNDNIENFQILTLAENNIKHANTVGKKMVTLKCPECHKEFEKEYRQTHLCKGGTYSGCSRKCSTTFGAKFQHNKEDVDLLKAIEENVIKIFKA